MANPFDIANFNLTNFANIYPDVMDSDPKTVEYTYKDANGNIKTKNVENRGLFKKHIWDDVGGALGQFDRTFYVDAENGDDNNDGSSSNPFKTIEKAANASPIGARTVIYLRSDISQGIYGNLHNKRIFVFLNGYTWDYNEDKNISLYDTHFGIYRGSDDDKTSVFKINMPNSTYCFKSVMGTNSIVLQGIPNLDFTDDKSLAYSAGWNGTINLAINSCKLNFGDNNLLAYVGGNWSSRVILITMVSNSDKDGNAISDYSPYFSGLAFDTDNKLTNFLSNVKVV